MTVPSYCMEHTDHHCGVSASQVMAQGLARGHRCFPRSSHGVVELEPRDRIASIDIIATSQFRFDTRYRGLTVLFSSRQICLSWRYI
jgi:hypothetical protein